MADAADVGIVGTAVGAGLYGIGWAARKLFGSGKESNGHRTVVECMEIHKHQQDTNSREHAELHEKFNKVATDVAFIRGLLEHRGGAS